MKKNNKGFMLAEVIVTATILLTIMVSLFFTYNRIYTRYNKTVTYKNLDGNYAIERIIEYMYSNEENNNLNEILLTLNPNTANKPNYKYLIENKSCKLPDNTYCSELQKAYNINNLIILKQTNEARDELQAHVTNKTFIDYFDYLKKYYSYTDYTKDSYLFIIEYKINETDSDDNYNYSSVELR